MGVSNDKFCTWINELNPRTNIQTLSKDLECEWLIVGAGYTGLSAARKLAEIYPNKTITLIDAQLAGEGASSRNSGYLVDTTLNDGFTSDRDLENYKKKTDIYELGIKAIKKFIKENQHILIESTDRITQKMRERGGGLSNIKLVNKSKELKSYYQLNAKIVLYQTSFRILEDAYH